MMKKLLVEVGELTDKEFVRANEQYPAFASDQEGFAVIEEEYEEACEALTSVYEMLNAMKAAIRKNDAEEVRKVATAVYDKAQCVAAESVQAAAMAQKLIESQALRKTKEWPALPMLK